jgi:hypothetical protein
MHRKATLLLGMLYMAVLLRPMLPSVLFSINQSYIQSQLCNQKDIKGNTCKGACFMKKLQAQQERSQELPGILLEDLELVQLQPAWEGLAVGITVGASSWTAGLNALPGDQFVCDLPVPPPWINDRNS